MIWTLFKIEEMPERLLESSYSITPSTICVAANGPETTDLCGQPSHKTIQSSELALSQFS